MSDPCTDPASATHEITGTSSSWSSTYSLLFGVSPYIAKRNFEVLFLACDVAGSPRRQTAVMYALCEPHMERKLTYRPCSRPTISMCQLINVRPDKTLTRTTVVYRQELLPMQRRRRCRLPFSQAPKAVAATFGSVLVRQRIYTRTRTHTREEALNRAGPEHGLAGGGGGGGTHLLLALVI